MSAVASQSSGASGSLPCHLPGQTGHAPGHAGSGSQQALAFWPVQHAGRGGAGESIEAKANEAALQLAAQHGWPLHAWYSVLRNWRLAALRFNLGHRVRLHGTLLRAREAAALALAAAIVQADLSAPGGKAISRA